MADRQLRCVLLDRVYDLWGDPVAQRMFQNLVELKRTGFGKEYGYGVLPVDTQDLTSTHFAIVDEANGGMVPLMAARMTTLDRSRLFNQGFPAVQLCALAAAPYHGSAVQQLIDRCTAEGRKLSYWGLWTIHPDARADPALAMYLAKSLAGIGMLLANEMGVTDQILGATLRFKVDRSGKAWGFEPMMLDGAPLPPLEVAHLLGEPVLLMHQAKPTELVHQMMEEYRPIWDTKLVLAPGGKITNDPPPDAKIIPRPDHGAAHAPVAVSSYTPSLLYARERYGALPEVAVGQYGDYMKAMMVIVGADGSITPGEWRAIQELIRQLGLHEKMVQELKHFDWKHADLTEVLKPLGGSNVARRMLYDAARIAFEEGMSDKETEAIHLAAQRLDVPLAVVDTIVSLVRDEAEIDAMRAAELFPERKRPQALVSEEGRILVGGNLLDMLSHSDRARLFALGRPQVVEAGEEVVRQGTVGDCLFVVEEGELAVVRCLPGDEEEILASAHAGMLLGELAVLDGGARAASLRAVRRSVLRVIGLGAFEALVLHGADTGHRILRAVTASIHERLNTTRKIAAASVAAPLPPPPPGPVLTWAAPGPEVMSVLQMLPAEAGLNDSAWGDMKSKLSVASVARGTDLVFPESSQPGVVVVLRGSLSPWLDDVHGPEVTTPSIGPGGFVDYAAALGFSAEPRRWRARSATQLLRIDPELFDPREPSSAGLLYALSRNLATTLRRTTGLSMHFRMANFRMAWGRASTASRARA